jgi:hypothetical protein
MEPLAVGFSRPSGALQRAGPADHGLAPVATLSRPYGAPYHLGPADHGLAPVATLSRPSRAPRGSRDHTLLQDSYLTPPHSHL